ncbi:unnamed protein product [Arctogadus glacialis]
MEQKYVRITEPNLEEFLDAAFMKFSISPPTEGVTVYDETGTEVDADVFEDVAQQPNAGVFTIRFKHTLEGATGSSLPDAALELSNYNPEDSVILELLSCTSDDTIILEEDSSPSAKRQKQDRDAKHLVESALAKKPGGDRIVKEYNRTKGLTDSSRRQMVNILAADMTETHGMAPPRHQKMKITFEYRRRIVLDEEKSSDVLTEFPRFRDVKGLVEQDFILQFGEDVAAKFLERWPTTFKQKIIQQSKALPTTSELEELIYCAEATSNEREGDEASLGSGWDSDLSSILLLHLIPPSAQGRKRPGKVSATQAEKHLVVFMKSGTSVQEHVDAITSSTQPYLLAIGMNRATINEFFIVMDKQAIPCRSTSSLGAFDELFKTHFVFGIMYNQMLQNMYTFVQTTVFNIDVGKVRESPRVAEIRARLLQ